MGGRLSDADSDDALTLVAIGVLVSIVASLAHEDLGHGLGCLLDGGRITLITFLVFRCAGAGAIADGGGPMGAFAIGSVALLLVWAMRPRSMVLKLFLFNLGALVLLWFWGQMIPEALARNDDWGHVASELNWPSQWQAITASIALVGYVVTVRIVGRMAGGLAGGRAARLLIPYLAATVSAILLGASWHGDRIGSALDGFLSFGVTPLGYLFVIRRIAPKSPVPGAIGRNTVFLGAAVAVWALFALTLARGIGPLS